LGGIAFAAAEPEKTEASMTPSSGYIVVDSKNCFGCQQCMMTCSLVHEGVINTSLSRIQICQDWMKTWPGDIKIAQCRQCVTAPCVMACPTGACHIDEDNGNARVIDEQKCIGCQQCLRACSFLPHRIIWNPEKNKSMKCDFCADTPYWDEEGGVGGKQACVEACPSKVLTFVADIPSQVDESEYDFGPVRTNYGWGGPNNYPEF
jgi:protein NrfC